MSGQGQQGDDKNAMQILWIIFGLFMLAAGIWWGFSKELKMLFIFVKTWELKFLEIITKFTGLTQIHHEVAAALKVVTRLTPESIGSNAALEVTTVSGKYYAFQSQFSYYSDVIFLCEKCQSKV